MKTNRWKWMVYFISTGVLPILLFYPAMIYYDLAGMGRYGGIAFGLVIKKYWGGGGVHAEEEARR